MAKEETKSEKKPETVVLKVETHCDECFQKVKKAVGKLHGVESMNFDLKENKITLAGKITADQVLKRVKNTGKQVEILQPKQNKESDKKGAEKKEGGAADKKDSDKKDSAKKDGDTKDSGKSGEVKRLMYSYPANELTYKFSDENPNNITCSIM